MGAGKKKNRFDKWWKKNNCPNHVIKCNKEVAKLIWMAAKADKAEVDNMVKVKSRWELR